jgi:purine-nucleoside phosphorylase
MTDSSHPFASTLDVLARLVPEHLRNPRIGIVCGSGLSTLVSSLRDVVEVPYTALEGFAKSTGRSFVLRADRTF